MIGGTQNVIQRICIRKTLNYKYRSKRESKKGRVVLHAMGESKMVQICMITLFLLATQRQWSYTHGSSDTVRKVNIYIYIYKLLFSILFEFYDLLQFI